MNYFKIIFYNLKMSFWYFFKLGFLLIYFSICGWIANFIYKGEKQFYEPVYVIKRTGEGKNDVKKVSIHDEFDEFARKDTPVALWRLFFGAISITIFKLIASMCFALSLSIKLFRKIKKKEEKKEKFTKEEIEQNIESTKAHTRYFLRFSGIFSHKSRLPDEDLAPIYQNILVLIIKLIMMVNFVAIYAIIHHLMIFCWGWLITDVDLFQEKM